MRVGQGYDVHRLVEGRKLILGGVEIPFERGLLGHSDADVLCHAVADALLGALALRDIGAHFPPSDVKFKNISSLVLLQRVAGLLREKSARVVNVDSTIIAERPKLGPYIPLMARNLARVLQIGSDRISIKATTTEGLGALGTEEGIAAQAVVLVEEKERQD
ncbi:MAG: 2-C-methyl-D-erythritol 2,4-cyclodiphosphate synthase [Candidatus Latescibacteria bacterium 4484_181]|nr:MAG: 2-C-methyl-D-erythritol 2,4-cyclodiphosphate synthase [Candidatus Latescibacteria bacterium 4484_181]RKY68933.1 MAG: 2-C-methyl-D-erythritol 2,4-cyclodiphosphate synthase [Candidatus Latescibacterota bacterium]RKY73209.1 MAG: 2-C-methyl-D-erythritol 2,4-cyclodiphosphate synthase [Candidatus Latescibacterota bacterium]